MRFRLKNNEIRLFLSDREIERYQCDLQKENTIEGIEEFKLQEGKHTVKVNDIEVDINVQIVEENVGYRAIISSDKHEFSFHKIKEISKYDLFRNLVANLRFMV